MNRLHPDRPPPLAESVAGSVDGVSVFSGMDAVSVVAGSGVAGVDGCDGAG